MKSEKESDKTRAALWASIHTWSEQVAQGSSAQMEAAIAAHEKALVAETMWATLEAARSIHLKSVGLYQEAMDNFEISMNAVFLEPK